MRTFLLAAAAVLCLAAAALLAARAWLETSRGERWLAGQLAGRVSDAVAGELRVGRVDLEGLSSATAFDVELRAPDGALAARAHRVDVTVALAELRSATKVVDRLAVSGLGLELVGGGDGFAIARALEPAAPSVPEPDEPGGGGVVVRNLRVELDRFAILPAPGAAPSFAAVDGIATGSLEAGDDAVAVDAEVTLTLAAPVEGPAAAALSVRLDDGRIRVERLEATLPGGVQVRARSADRAASGVAGRAAGGAGGAPRASARSEARGGARGGDAGGGLALGDLEIGITLPAEGLVPFGGPALRGALEVEGDVAQRGDRVALDVVARPSGPGRILAEGTIDRRDGDFSLRLDVRGIDPARLLEGAPRGRLWAALDASGTGRDPARLAGTVRLAPSRIAGACVGPGRARVRLRDGRLHASGIALEVPGGTVAGHLALGGGAPPTGEVTASVRSLARLAPNLRALGIDVPELEGEVEARVAARGSGAARTIHVEATSGRAVVAGRALEDLDLEASVAEHAASAALDAVVAGRHLSLEARAERVAPGAVRLGGLALDWGDAAWRLDGPARIAWGGDRLRVEDLVLEGTGRIALAVRAPLGGAGRGRPLRADVRIEDLPLEPLRPLLPRSLPPGAVSAELAFRGTPARPEVDVDAVVTLRPGGREEIALALDVEATRSTLAIDATAWIAADDAVQLSARLRAGPRQPLWDPQGLLASRVEATLDAGGLSLARLRELGILPVEASGELALALRASGVLREADVEGELRLTGLAVEDPELGKLPPISAELRLDAGREVVLEALTRVQGAPPARARFRARGSLATLLGGDGAAPFEGRVEVERGPLDLPRVPASARAVALVVEAGGTLEAPHAKLRAEAEGLSLRGEALGAASLEASLAPGLKTAQVRIAPAQGGALAASARLARDAPWEAEIVADRARISLAEALPRLAAVEGAIVDGTLRVRGGVEPSARGRLALDVARLAVPGFATLRDVVLRLEAEGRSVALERAAASIGGGRADARGRVRLAEDGGTAELHVESDGFPVPVGPRPVGALTTEIDVRLALAGDELTGSVRVAPGDLRLPDGLPGELHPMSLPSDVVVHAEGEDPDGGAPSRLAAFLEDLRARVTVRAPDDFWIRSEAANLEVSADLVARWEGERLAFTGEIVVPRGTVTVIRRRFEVERITLGFRGDPDVDPSLDGRLAYEQQTVDVWIGLAGSLRDPTLELSSDPPMDPSQIAALVAVGPGGAMPGEGEGAGTGVSSAVLSGALNFVAGQVGEAIAGNLPLDVLAFELGPGGEARRLEAGAYLTPRLFVSFVRNLLAEPDENTHEVRAEYELLRRLTLTTRYGDRQSGGLDLLYERRFASPKQRARAERARSEVAPVEVGAASVPPP